MPKDENRCWPGYEPVKGKPAHSQGSCRPEADSKLTKTGAQVRKKRKKEVEGWQSAHPGAKKSAAQHLHAPGAKPKAKATKKKVSASPRKNTPANAKRKS